MSDLTSPRGSGKKEHFFYSLTLLSLQQLESALPLATHLNENLSEVEAWLEEMEAELRAQGQPGENLEEVKKQHDHLKVGTVICPIDIYAGGIFVRASWACLYSCTCF